MVAPLAVAPAAGNEPGTTRECASHGLAAAIGIGCSTRREFASMAPGQGKLEDVEDRLYNSSSIPPLGSPCVLSSRILKVGSTSTAGCSAAAIGDGCGTP